MEKNPNPATPIIRHADFKFKRLEPKDIDEVMEFVQEFFTKREVLINKSEISNPDDIMCLMKCLSNNCLSCKASVAIIYEPTNELAGLCLTKVLTKSEQEGFNVNFEWNKKEKGFLNVLRLVETKLNIFDNPSIEKVLEIMITTCNPKFSGKGLTYMLTEKIEEIGRELGCDLCYAQSTSPATQHIRSKCGYECRYKVFYNSIVVDEKPLHDSKPGEGPYIGLMVKDLRKLESA